jgi:cold shock CspA family protein
LERWTVRYDVFISHATEDKADFVAELADALRERGLSVWYDDFTLKMGDSLSASINKGIAESAFGIVVLSQSFFSKQWPQRELAAMIAREDNGEKVILPIWHKISKQDVLKHLPLLADKLAVSSEHGINTVVEKILDAIEPSSRIRDPYTSLVGGYHICLGKVRFFNERKGFGFINGEDGKEYFMHISDFDETVTMADGDSVAFLAEKGDRGVKAAAVRRI